MHVTTLITRKHSTTYIVLGGERILVSELGASPLEGQPTKSTVGGGGLGKWPVDVVLLRRWHFMGDGMALHLARPSRG
jgi:hypothetical protein